MNLKKYVIGLGSDNSGLIKGLGEADKEISSFISKAGKLLGGLGLGAGFAKIIKDFTGTGSELKTFSDSTGIAVEDVSRLGLALEQFGGDTADAAAALNGLQDGIRQAVDWGQGPLIDVMGRYGVSVQNANGQIKTASELYYDLADVMRGLNKAQQRDLASSLGLDESSVRLLQQGREGVEELLATRADMTVMTAADAEAAREWEVTLKDLKQIMTGLGRELARITLPAIRKFADFGKKIASEWQKHKDTIDHVANVIKENLVPAFAFAALKIGAAMRPLLLKLAPLTAIALLIEDIAVFMQGGQSLLGDLLGDNGDKVRDTLKSIFGSLSGILTGVLTGDFKGAFEEAEKLWNDILVPVAKSLGQFIVTGIIEAWPEIKKWLGDLGNGLKEIFLQALDELIFKMSAVPVLGDFAENHQGFSELYKNRFKTSETDKDALKAAEELRTAFNLKNGEERTFLKKAYESGFKGQEDVKGYFDRIYINRGINPFEEERTAQALKNAENGDPIPGISSSAVNNASSNTNNVTVNQTFNGPADPDNVYTAARSGAEKGVSSAPDYSAALAFGQGAY